MRITRDMLNKRVDYLNSIQDGEFYIYKAYDGYQLKDKKHNTVISGFNKPKQFMELLSNFINGYVAGMEHQLKAIQDTYR